MQMHTHSSHGASLAADRFDVLVIGGGINGVAIARECARAGRKVALVERSDFAAGVTSRSTRMIHGGLRYLEHGEIGLVRESLRERERLLRRHPNLVRPMQFLLAVTAENRPFMRSALAIRTGLWLYHHLAGARPAAYPDADSFERQLNGGHKWSVYSYEDAQCEFPELLVSEWLEEAIHYGSVASNHTEVLEILLKSGRVSGVRVRNGVSGKEFEVSAAQVVNASGPWVDLVLGRSSLNSRRLIGGVRGSHLVLPQFPGSPDAAVYAEALDGRPVFVIPWNRQVLVGSTEITDSEDPANTQPAAAEINYLFESFSRLFPHSGLSISDIRFSMAGVRPLPYSPGTKLAAVTRRHVIHDHQEDGAGGLFSIIGGKLTTAMSLAREVARKLGIASAEPANVFAAPAPADGIESSLNQWAHLVSLRANIPESSAHAIAAWHGKRAMAIATASSHDERLRLPLCSHSDHIVAEAVEAVTHELAVTLGDILLRRVPVALGACWSESCSRESASRIGLALGWDRQRIHQEFESLEEERGTFLHPAQGSGLTTPLRLPDQHLQEARKMQ